jgi:hypothetical protein
MSFEKHVDAIIRSATRAAIAINRACRTLTFATISELVRSLLFPILDYCGAVFLDVSAYLKDRLRRAENFIVRLCFGRRRRDSASELFLTYGWQRWNVRSKRQQLVTMYKCLHDPTPLFLTKVIVYRSCEPRGDGFVPLRLPRVNLEIGRRRFAYSGARAWNELPGQLKSLRLGSFKRNLTTYLAEQFA